jgi:hypothetical protein
MAGRKFGVVMMARVPESYYALSAAEQAKPGKAFEQTLKKYAGKVDLIRRYWTRAFSADVTDVFIFECDDMADMHAFQDDLDRGMAKAPPNGALRRHDPRDRGINPTRTRPRSAAVAGPPRPLSRSPERTAARARRLRSAGHRSADHPGRDGLRLYIRGACRRRDQRRRAWQPWHGRPRAR